MCVQTWAWDIPRLQIPNREEVVCLQIFLKMQDCLPFHRFDATSLANQWTVKASSTETSNEVYSPAKQKELVQHRKPRPHGLQKLFGLEILRAASQPWIIWGQKKNPESAGYMQVFNFHSWRPCSDLTFDCSPEHRRSLWKEGALYSCT